jgi:hypothetical protein
LSTAAIPLLAFFVDETGPLQLADDDAGGVIGERSVARDIRLGGLSHTAQHRQDHALIELANMNRV